MQPDPSAIIARHGGGRPVVVRATSQGRFHINGPAIVELDYYLGGQLIRHRVRNLATSASFAAEPGWLQAPDFSADNVVILEDFRPRRRAAIGRPL